MSSEKSLGVVLHAVAIVKRSFPNFRLAVMGTGFLEPYLVEMASHIGVSDIVDFIGFVSPDMLPVALEEIDVLVGAERWLRRGVCVKEG